jgi:hypothetical protein
MLHTLKFFSSKCRLFHNATFFGSCIIHILHTGCAKKIKKIRMPKVNAPYSSKWPCVDSRRSDVLVPSYDAVSVWVTCSSESCHSFRQKVSGMLWNTTAYSCVVRTRHWSIPCISIMASNTTNIRTGLRSLIQCVRKVAVHLGYGR